MYDDLCIYIFGCMFNATGVVLPELAILLPHIRLEEDIQVEFAKKFIAAMIEFKEKRR